MASRYRSKVFIVTGAGEGIGAELALQLADRGHCLVLAARSEVRLREVADRCRHSGSKAIAFRAGVTVEEDRRRRVERALPAFGRIDALVKNADLSMHATFDEASVWASCERLRRVNCLGTVNCTRFAWPCPRAAPGKRGVQIIGISSLAGRTGVPGRTTDCAGKFAQTGLLEALRIEEAEHSLNGKGQTAGVSGLVETGAMPVDECARQIVRSIQVRRRELVMAAKACIGPRLKLVVPGRVDNLARDALTKKDDTE